MRYFLTDLDGTLLRSDASISEFTVNTITKLLNKDIVISYATARSYISSMRVVSDVPWKYPVVLYNGAMIYNPLSKKIIDGFLLDYEISNKIIEAGKKFGLNALLFTVNGQGVEKVFHEKLVRYGDLEFLSSRENDPRFTEVKAVECPKDCRALIITYIGLLDELIPIKNYISERFGKELYIHLTKDNYIKDHYFLEFSHIKANKKDGLKLWAKLIGCKEEDITVFGDNLNDLGLFHAAGTKITVSNGHEELIKIADLIIESNDEDAVAKYLEGCDM